MKTKYIAHYAPNEMVDAPFLAHRKEVRFKKTGGEYLFLVLADRTGTLSGFMWDNCEVFKDKFEAGDVIQVNGLTREYNGALQVTVHKVRKLAPDTVDLGDFLRSTEKNPDDTFEALMEVLRAEVRMPPLRQLLEDIFADEGLRKRFKSCPAAKALHHAYIGGLLEHTDSVVRLCRRACDHYPSLNRSLLLTAATLHDLMKTEELSWGKSFEYTDEGRLIGHITLNAVFLDQKMRAVPLFPAELRMELLHSVLSHHGELEFGSPKRPKTMEALVLSYLDDLDAKVQSFREAAAQPGESDRWTPFNTNFQRFLYRESSPDHPPEAPGIPPETGMPDA